MTGDVDPLGVDEVELGQVVQRGERIVDLPQ